MVHLFIEGSMFVYRSVRNKYGDLGGDILEKFHVFQNGLILQGPFILKA